MKLAAPHLPHDTEPPTDRRGAAAFASGEYPAAEPIHDDVDALEPASSAARMCDAVHVTGEGGDGVVYVLGGELAWVSAHVGLRSLRERLIDEGHVSRAEMVAATALARADGTNVFAKLRALGLVESDALARAVREHAREHLLALLNLSGRHASWTRSQQAFAPELAVPIIDVLGPTDLRRFRRMLVDAGGSPVQRHDDARIPLRRTAEVESVNGRTVMTTLDISDAGVRLRGASLLPITSRVVVRLSIAGERLELEGRVAGIERTSESEAPALVVLWTDLPEATDEAFARILEALY